MILGFFLCLLFLILGWFLSFSKQNMDLEQSSPYECGFSSFQMSRNYFSIYFFMLAILFIVFDIELVILLPLCYFSLLGLSKFSFFMVILFLLILYLGLVYEWRDGMLSW